MIGNPMGNVFGNPMGNPLGLQRAGADISPVGTITTRTTGPDANEMIADGRQLLKAEYSKLYSAIGDAYSLADFSKTPVPVQTVPAIPVGVRGLAYGNEILIALGPTTCSISKDKGFTWGAGGTLATGTWVTIVYGGGMFLIISTAGDTATSIDGVTWSVRGSNIPGRSSYIAAYGNGRFVILSPSQTSAYTSLDGITFASSVTTLPTLTYVDIAFGNGVFISVASGTGSAITSPDGVFWTVITIFSATWTNVVFGNGFFLAINSSTNPTARSRDGVSWVAINTTPASTNLTFSRGYFLLLTTGATPAIRISVDGAYWANGPSNTVAISGAARSSVDADGVLVALGTTGGAGLALNLVSSTIFSIPNIQTFGMPSAYIKVT